MLIFSEFFCEEEYFGSSFRNIYTSSSFTFDPCITIDLGYLKLPKGAKMAPVLSDHERTLPELLFSDKNESCASSRLQERRIGFYSTKA